MNTRKYLQIPCLAFLSMLALSFGFTGELMAASKKKPVKVSREYMAQAGELQAREDKLSIKEKELQQKEEHLVEIQKEVDEKLIKLTALQTDIKDKLERFEGVRDRQFRNLVNIYTAMSSTKVAPILDKLEDKNVARILRAMNAENVAKIVPKLDKDKAVRVSKLLGMLD